MKVSKNFSIDTEVLQKLEVLAKTRNMSVSKAVNDILEHWLKEEEKKQIQFNKKN